MKIHTIAGFTLAAVLATATLAAADHKQSTTPAAAQKAGPMEHLQVWGTAADTESAKELERQREALAQQVKREQLRTLRLRQEAEMARFRAEKERAVAETEARDSLKAQEQEAVRTLKEQPQQPEQKTLEKKAEEPT